MNEGLYLLSTHYRASPSTSPPPLPQPCSKCAQFRHVTENCPNKTQCSKCDGKHRTEKCTTTLTMKCTACNTTEHVAWSIQCPERPVKPIEGIPNTRIKTLNRKSKHVDANLEQDNRIHEPITTHDFIINVYTHKINKPSTTNRAELIQKLKGRFIKEFNMDAIVVFFGNWMYVLMVDLEKPEEPSPTQIISQARCAVTNNSS